MSEIFTTTIAGCYTSSSDQDLLPPTDIFRARRLDGSGDCDFNSGRGERIWGWWWSIVRILEANDDICVLEELLW